jgi:hypothetical protein
MQLSSLDFFFDEFAEEQMNFLYTGDFTDAHTPVFIELNDLQFSAYDEIKISHRRAGFLIAECFQNIIRHHNTSHRDSYFHVNIKHGVFSIVSGNRLQNKHIPSLKAQLEQLNALTSEELKEVYRKVLLNGEMTDKGGAGLGLIEMARKSENKLSFSFSEIDDHTSYFYFKLHLKWNKSKQAIPKHGFDHSIELRRKMLSDNLLFAYKGEVSIKTTTAILGIIESSLQSNQQKVLFIRFMGLFENLSSLSNSINEENKKLLLIGEANGSYHIGASCLLAHQEARSMERVSKLYASFDQASLEQEYKSLKANNEGSEFKLVLLELLLSDFGFTFDFQSQTEGVAKVDMILTFGKRRKYTQSTEVEVEKAEESSYSIYK